MDAFNEKKWFVYLGDHHEGPFALGEIQGRMVQGQFGPGNFVWAEGMSDWRPMTDVPEFAPILRGPVSSDAAPGGASASTLASLLHQQGEPSLVFEPAPAAQAILNNKPAEPATEAVSPFALEPETPAVVEAIAEPATEALPFTLEPAAAAPVAETVPMMMEDAGPSIVIGPMRKGAPVSALREREDDDPTEEVPAATADALDAALARQEETTHAGAKRRLPVKTFATVTVLIALAGAYSAGMLDATFDTPAIRAALGPIADAVRPVMIKASDRFPFLGGLVSPIPAMDDVNAEEFEDLKRAARGAGGMPQVALALARKDPAAPAMYVASNLPDGAAFDVHVEGLPDTLLNQMSFSAKLRAVVTGRIGKTAVVRFPDSRPVPQGQYRVTVMEADQQSPAITEMIASAPVSSLQGAAPLPQGRKLVAQKTYFLGGLNDNAYKERLKEYHDRVRGRANTEIAELRQFAGLLEGQVDSTAQEFARAQSVKPAKAQIAGWNAFHARWAGLHQDFTTNAAKWSPEALQNEYLFGPAYQAIKDGVRLAAELHDAQSRFFTMAGDRAPYVETLTARAAQAKTYASQLNAAIGELEKAQPAAGLPKRDALKLPALPVEAPPAAAPATFVPPTPGAHP